MARLLVVDVRLEYNFKGILSVPGRALKAKKIFICSLYLFCSVIIYTVCSYLALIIDGNPLSQAYSEYGMIPCNCILLSSIISSIIYYFGVGLALLMVACAIMATAAFDFEIFRGNHFFSAKQAIKFCNKRIAQLFMSWLAIALFIGFIVLLGIIVGLITRIPYIGEALYGVFFFFPNFFVTIFLVLIIYIFALSFFIMPVAVAFDKSGETFNSILETFSTIIRQPARWFGYTVYSVIAAKICGFIFAYFAFRAVQLLQLTTEIGGGEKINNLFAAGLSHLPTGSKAVDFTTNIFPGIDFGFDINSMAGAGNYEGPVGYLISISLFLVFLTVWSYILSIIATGQAYSFAIIKYLRDGHAITDENNSIDKNTIN